MIKQFFVIIFVLNFSLLQARIHELKTMDRILEFIQPESLVIFDIDNTLIEPVQSLGSDQWFCHQINSYLNLGLIKEDALEKALSEWTSVQCITRVQLVEEKIEEIISELQNKNYLVIGLTTRGLGLATQTIHQLDSVGINLNLTAPCSKDYLFENEHSCLYRGGIIFTAGTHKGTALQKVLEHVNLYPKHIVFINDKESHLIPVEETCKELGIAFDGIRYGFLDDKIARFNSKITDFQFHRYKTILSDEECLDFLNH